VSWKLKQYATDFETTKEPSRIPAWSNGDRGDGLGCRKHTSCRHRTPPLEHHHKQRFLNRRRTARLAAMQRKEHA